MRKPMKVSEARKKLFDLVDEVIEDEDTVVLIEHRDRAKRAALVSEDHLRFLEATIAGLRSAHAVEFSLAGSIGLAVPPDEIDVAIDSLRVAQAGLAGRKLEGF